jgi:hypothetical protein
MSGAIQLYQGATGELLLNDGGEMRPILNQEIAQGYLQICQAFQQGAIAAHQVQEAYQFLVQKEREAYGLAVSAMNTAIQAHQSTNTVLVEENRALRDQNNRLVDLADKLAENRSGNSGSVEIVVEVGSGWGWQEVAPIFWLIMLIIGLSGIISFAGRAYEYHLLRQQMIQPTIQQQR